MITKGSVGRSIAFSKMSLTDDRLTELKERVANGNKHSHLAIYKIYKKYGLNVSLVDGKGNIDLGIAPASVLDEIRSVLTEEKSSDLSTTSQIIPISTFSNSNVSKQLPFLIGETDQRKNRIVEFSHLVDAPQDAEVDILEFLERGSRKPTSTDSTQLRVKKKIKECIKKLWKHKRVYVEKSYGRDLNDRDEIEEDDNYSVAADDEEDLSPQNDLVVTDLEDPEDPELLDDPVDNELEDEDRQTEEDETATQGESAVTDDEKTDVSSMGDENEIDDDEDGRSRTIDADFLNEKSDTSMKDRFLYYTTALSSTIDFGIFSPETNLGL